MKVEKSREGKRKKGITIIIREKGAEADLITQEMKKALRKSKRLLGKKLQYEIFKI